MAFANPFFMRMASTALKIVAGATAATASAVPVRILPAAPRTVLVLPAAPHRLLCLPLPVGTESAVEMRTASAAPKTATHRGAGASSAVALDGMGRVVGTPPAPIRGLDALPIDQAGAFVSH